MTRAVSPLGYSDQGGGINNQKFALLGLFVTVWRTGPKQIVLPDVTDYDVSLPAKPQVPFGQVFDIEAIQRFAASHGIEILPRHHRVDGRSWDYMNAGAAWVANNAHQGTLTADDVGCEFFRHLVPLIGASSILRDLARRVFTDMGIQVVLQLRIEQDWARHAREELRPLLGATEDYAPSFETILRKVKASLPAWKHGIYAACDENDLPLDKETIRALARRQVGIELLWKSDLLARARLSALSRSLLDFEMALRAPVFVGLTRSSFSNLAAFETFCRTRAPAPAHYIYDTKSLLLQQRRDNGAGRSPREAITGVITGEV